ncbi:MAG: SAM-dependent methyltransferase [Burkholderiaceae bacterium]|nr:SAM-dependent methyltransferase [Burkholderiaceae bacterium]
MSGRVVFVGAGPGAADLITLRGARHLAAANVVLADSLTDPVLRDLAPRATWIDVGKRGFCDSTGQSKINALLVHHASRGALVVRLKGGDPSGRLEEELQALAEAGIAADVVPGVTAALAAAAATRRPLTRRGRGRSVSLTTAVSARADGTPSLALSRQLLAVDWAADTPVCVVSRAGCVDELASDHTVASLVEASMLHAGRPAVVTVGVGAAPLSRSRGPRAPCQVKTFAPARPPRSGQTLAP